MLTLTELKQISLYTIDRRSSETFDEPTDTTQLTDEIITEYALSTINKRYDNQRELQFNLVSDGDHPIVSKIQSVLDDIDNIDLFKRKSKNIASILFGHTTLNAKKGDLLTCLFREVDKYRIVLLKIDENKILRRGEDGLWILNSGLDVETKLQKAAYIVIPIIDGSYQNDYLQWEVKAIDNISNDSAYWNIDFLSAHYKSDSKINSERFGNFFKRFIGTISDPIKQNDLMYSYRSYLNINDNFAIDEFEDAVFGRTDRFTNEKVAFRSTIVEASSNQENGFDLAFDFHEPTVKKLYAQKGSFVFDGMLKISPINATGNQGNDENILNESIKFKNDGSDTEYEDTNGKYAKVYYSTYGFDFK